MTTDREQQEAKSIRVGEHNGGDYDMRHSIHQTSAEVQGPKSEALERAEAGLLGYLESQRFHPDASHVSPDYREGYNRALQVVIDRVQDERRMRALGEQQ